MSKFNPFKKLKENKEEKQRELKRQQERERMESIIKERKRLESLKQKKQKKVKIAGSAIIAILASLMFFSNGDLDDPEELTDENYSVETVIDVEADEAESSEEDLQLDKERKEKAKQIVKDREKLLAEQRELREKKKLEREKEKELTETNPNKTGETEAPKEIVNVPAGEDEVKVNDNIPRFSNDDITSSEVYHLNGPLDSLGRVTAANAVVGVEIMPAEQRGSISQYEPTGWSQASYANIGSGGWLYNRSHLIGHQLTGNDDYENLMTGTRWFNMRMLEYENFVAYYVETTENHVRYRITPVFEGNNLVASGAYMEGFSIEDNGEGLMFNVYIPNVQPGVEINYADGSSIGPEGPSQEGEIAQYNPGGNSGGNSNNTSSTSAPSSEPEPTPPPAPVETNSYVDENGNGLIKGSNSGIYHLPGSTYYDRTTNPAEMFKSIEEAVNAGYRPPKR